MSGRSYTELATRLANVVPEAYQAFELMFGVPLKDVISAVTRASDSEIAETEVRRLALRNAELEAELAYVRSRIVAYRSLQMLPHELPDEHVRGKMRSDLVHWLASKLLDDNVVDYVHDKDVIQNQWIYAANVRVLLPEGVKKKR